MLETLFKDNLGKLFGDRAYLSKEIGERLLKRGLKLFTNLRSNMKQKLISLKNKILLKKRSLIETVNDELKKHLPNRAYSPQKYRKFSSQYAWWDCCLLPSTEKAFVEFE
ncbi:hypothetical protein PARA125_000440 [Parachlamydia sp. AcF125]|nr:hypothetical protein [Parachlamydia sp. AcF125]